MRNFSIWVVNVEKYPHGEPVVLIHLVTEDFLLLCFPVTEPPPTAPSQMWICFAERCPFSAGLIIHVSFSLWVLAWMIPASLPLSLAYIRGFPISPSWTEEVWSLIYHFACHWNYSYKISHAFCLDETLLSEISEV